MPFDDGEGLLSGPIRPRPSRRFCLCRSASASGFRSPLPLDVHNSVIAVLDRETKPIFTGPMRPLDPSNIHGDLVMNNPTVTHLPNQNDFNGYFYEC